MSEAKPQDGSTVKGYRELSFGEIGKMNQLKISVVNSSNCCANIWAIQAALQITGKLLVY